MSEARQRQDANSVTYREGDKLFPVQVSPTEVRYMTPQQLADSITDDDIKRGLELAGSFNIDLSEEELFERLNTIRYGSEPTPEIEMPE